VSAGSGLAEAIGRIAAGGVLERGEARAVMDEILAGKATPAQLGAFLVGLRVRGETVDEVAGFVESLRAAAVPVRPKSQGLVDLCGTGGDGLGTINISTAASLVAAAAGAPVAKHGNRSASSLCGSADVLEALGVPIELEPTQIERSIDELGFGFLFAPRHHPAMRHVAGVRRELKLRTVFNLLGPLANPAGVRRQLLGVFADELRVLMGSVLSALGVEMAWIVHGDGGIDEVSLSGPTRVTEVDAKGRRELEVAPEDAGLARRPLTELRGGDARANAAAIESVLRGEPGAPRDAVVLNAAAALVVAGKAADLPEGAARASEAIASGAARRLLDALRAFA
jgi:anthranilate phosphoribosyltransferase